MTAPRTRTRGGFTLLEMLLTSLLTAVLMVGIWSLSTLYVAMFESGRDRTLETQLVRSLEQQLSEDLLAAIQVPGKDASPSPASMLIELDATSETTSDASSADETDANESAAEEFSQMAFVTFTTLPRFGLIGTERSLQLTILRATPPSPLEQGVVDPADDDLESRPMVHAPELRLVLYSFEEPYEREPNDRRPPAGLLRRELAWETARGLAGTDDVSMFTENFYQGAASSPLRADEPELTAAEEARLEQQPADQITGESITLVPEVVAIEFRYFDGRGWSSQWDSRARKTLPVAVEVAAEIMSAEELQELWDDSLDEDKEPIGLEQDADLMSLDEEPRGRIYRRLIFLPASARPGHGYGAFDRGFPLEQP